MSVKIRLSLTGRSHQISYRMVAQDTRSKRDGKFLEILGFVNPFQKEHSTKIDKDRIKYYVSRGATFTPSAKFVFVNGKLPPKPKKVKTKPEDQKPAEAVSSVSTQTQKSESDQETLTADKPSEAENQES